MDKIDDSSCIHRIGQTSVIQVLVNLRDTSVRQCDGVFRLDFFCKRRDTVITVAIFLRLGKSRRSPSRRWRQRGDIAWYSLRPS